MQSHLSGSSRVYNVSPKMLRTWQRMKEYGSSLPYNISTSISLFGEISVPAINAAISAMIEKHNALRTTFIDGKNVVMKINDYTPGWVITHKKITVSNSSIDISEHVNVQFDFSQDLMLKVWLFNISSSENILVFMMPHILSDGWSLNILARDFVKLYEAVLYNESFIDYYKTKQILGYNVYTEWINKEILSSSSLKNYWFSKLNGKDLNVKLPYDFKENQKNVNECGRNILLTVKSNMSDLITNLCKKLTISKPMLYLSIFELILLGWSNTTEIATTISVNGRNATYVDSIGYFVNTCCWIPLINSNDTINSYIDSIRESVLEILENQYYPDVCLNSELGFEKIYSNVFINISTKNSQVYRGSGLLIQPVPITALTTALDHDIEIHGFLTEDMLQNGVFDEIFIKYRDDLFSEDTINRLRDCFYATLLRFEGSEDVRVSDLVSQINKYMVNN